MKFECYACHETKGETFPALSESGRVGPELGAMGPLHEAQYRRFRDDNEREGRECADRRRVPSLSRAGSGKLRAIKPESRISWSQLGKRVSARQPEKLNPHDPHPH